MAASTLGHPDDFPSRSLAALRSADLLIFEEDRPARRALKAAGIHRDYLKFTEHGETETLEALTETIKARRTVCYMSDQGMPTVADPGRQLLERAYALGADVQVIPGPCSITAALAACPFLTAGFRYVGFLDRRPEERLAALQKLAEEAEPIVLLDTPYRLQALLDACAESHGAEHEALLALDISGENERYAVGSLASLRRIAEQLTEKLNFVLVLAGSRGRSGVVSSGRDRHRSAHSTAPDRGRRAKPGKKARPSGSRP